MIHRRKIASKITKFNDYIADKMSNGLSIMPTFYVILVLVLIPLIYQQPTNLVSWASYLCTVIFQGIALPVLGYTSRKSGNQTDAMLKKIYAVEEKMDKHIDMMEKFIAHLDEHFHTQKPDVKSPKPRKKKTT